ncbi:MAG: polysaccharide pyruvyl transferase family protein [Rhodocyclaceae bacterium]|nr:polysaccharide pyruvyl transferase family protein [Rhodocyclaceae bacterium]
MVDAESTQKAPTLLFGAHDRHNFGDLLFAQVAASYCRDRPLLAAGLVARDLSGMGGMALTRVADLSKHYGHAAVEIVHVGGELLTTSIAEAAVMLAEPKAAGALALRLAHARKPVLREIESVLGFRTNAPYVLDRTLFPRARRIVFNAVGGARLAHISAAMRREVVAKLKSADLIYVRERATQAALADAGISAKLAPDPVAIVVERFAERIDQARRAGEVAACRQRFPRGFLAVQFSADCGDEHTLDELARQLETIRAGSGLGIVFFRAGAAPWHDDLDVYRRCAQRLQGDCWIFASLEVWQIVALLASSQGFVGTSLHGTIVAAACALPRVSFLSPSLGQKTNKLSAYLEAWELPELAAPSPRARLAQSFTCALGISPARYRRHAKRLAALYHRAAEEIFAASS